MIIPRRGGVARLARRLLHGDRDRRSPRAGPWALVERQPGNGGRRSREGGGRLRLRGGVCSRLPSALPWALGLNLNGT